MTRRSRTRTLLLLALATGAVPRAADAQAASPEPPPVAAPAPTAPVQTAVRVVLVAARPVGVDPRAAAAVTEELRRTLVSAGYDVVPADQTQQALTSLGLSSAESAADLWKVTYATHAALGVTATVRAEAGQYVVDLTVADASGRGPYTTQTRSDAPGLTAASAEALRRTLPSNEPASPPPSAPPPPQSQPPPSAPAYAPAAPATGAAAPPAAGAYGAPAPPVMDRGTTAEPTEFKRLRLALQTEAAFGTTDDGFYNHLVGGRVDYRFARRISFGGYVGYVNLKGRGGRENNVLPYAQVDYRVYLGRSGTWQLPLRFGAGYLPMNGPFARLAVGIATLVSDDVELLIDVAVPALWVTKDLTVTSFDLAGEVGYMP